MQFQKSTVLISAGLLLIVGAAFLVIYLYPKARVSQMYPKPEGLPNIVADSMTEVLAQFEKTLAEKAPSVLARLQPGLTETDIKALEEKCGITLDNELRELYRWRNGMLSDADGKMLPGHYFLPLETSLKQFSDTKHQTKTMSGIKAAAWKAFAAYRQGWIQILDDGAGDGYFFDPDRKSAEGAYLYHFAEVGEYVFFPSLRNVIAFANEGYASGAFTVDAEQKLIEVFSLSEKIVGKYGTQLSTVD